MYRTVNVHEFIYSTSMTSVSLASIIKLSVAECWRKFHFLAFLLVEKPRFASDHFP